jgi:hypothetical protein
MKNKYNEKHLDQLKKCFYEDLDLKSSEDLTTLNVALNLFYGSDPKDNTNWVNAFKDSIKKKDKVTKGKQKFVDAGEVVKKKVMQDFSIIIEPTLTKSRIIKKQLSNLIKGFNEIEKTIIYEAPPYLISIDDQFKSEFVAEFILDKESVSPYSTAIRNCFSTPGDINEILCKNKCGFFDVVPLPLPINSKLRNSWATDDKFKIGNKRIFVYFFEWAIENYQKSLKFSNNHKLAVGIPLKNAITLYEHYIVNEFKLGNQPINFCEPHNIHPNLKKEGLWIQSYKNCVISTSNTPNGDLMKIAFDIPAGNI